jgi:uncharacterized protein YdbL (DUF1318 family)
MKMKSKLTIAMILMFLGAIFASAGSTVAAPKHEKEKQALQAKFEQRYPEIRQAKAAGKVGETSDGVLEAVKDADSDLRKLIKEENADRQALYKLLADEDSISEDVVAHRAAQRNIQKARKGEFVKEDGKWRQK